MTAGDKFTDDCNRLKNAIDDGADRAVIKSIAADLLREREMPVADYRGPFDNVGALLDQQTYATDKTQRQSPLRS